MHSKIRFINKDHRKIIAPSILSADFSQLQKEIYKVEKAGARWIHIDIMDGHFVPNITIGPEVVKSIRKVTKTFLDVHLMIDSPHRFVRQFIDAGSDGLTFHIESTKKSQLIQLLKYVKNKNLLSGISIKPKTSPEALKPFLPFTDLILVMSVEPGFGGQKYLPSSTQKIKQIAKIINSVRYQNKGLPFISVDGGINIHTIKDAACAGADILVAGNAIFSSPDGLSPEKAYQRLCEIVSGV